MRIGVGYDLHRLVPGKPLVLGGVTVPFDKGLDGHSDADALTHAVVDALFGAAALGNIGEHFPDTAPEYKDADSLELLKRTGRKVRDAGYAVGNVDAVLVAERPQLSPFVPAMREALASALDIPVDAVSVKPKTNEGVGPEGAGEAISAYAVAALESLTDKSLQDDASEEGTA